MTSAKMLSRRLVNHLLNSILKDHSKCQVCLSAASTGGLVTPSRQHSLRRPLPARAAVQVRAASTQTLHQQQVAALARPQGRLEEEEEALDAEAELRAAGDSFRYSELDIVPCPAHEMKPKPPADKLIFGHAFTDHMFRADWDQGRGWSRPLISKLHHLELHPAAKVLHYGLEAFEGAKAFRGQDNKIRFFRLDQNLRRLAHSARRLALAPFDQHELARCIHRLVRLDQDWIPQARAGEQLSSLYVRPTILGVEPSLGVASSRNVILYVLLSPVGPYFRTGFKPVSLYADPSFVRAWPGGAGNTKLGSNYAPTIAVQRQAEKLGLQQVLWLWGDDMKLTEVGTMNIFLVHRSADPQQRRLHLVTPPLSDGLILPGITRASILELARHWPDVVCEERYVTVAELEQLIHERRLVEMFGSGTACIVCPISLVQMKDGRKLRIPHSDLGTQTVEEGQMELGLTKRILKAITDIQYGRVEHPWAEELAPQ